MGGSPVLLHLVGCAANEGYGRLAWGSLSTFVVRALCLPQPSTDGVTCRTAGLWFPLSFAELEGGGLVSDVLFRPGEQCEVLFAGGGVHPHILPHPIAGVALPLLPSVHEPAASQPSLKRGAAVAGMGPEPGGSSSVGQLAPPKKKRGATSLDTALQRMEAANVKLIATGAQPFPDVKANTRLTDGVYCFNCPCGVVLKIVQAKDLVTHAAGESGRHFKYVGRTRGTPAGSPSTADVSGAPASAASVSGDVEPSVAMVPSSSPSPALSGEGSARAGDGGDVDGDGGGGSAVVDDPPLHGPDGVDVPAPVSVPAALVTLRASVATLPFTKVRGTCHGSVDGRCIVVHSVDDATCVVCNLRFGAAKATLLSRLQEHADSTAHKRKHSSVGNNSVISFLPVGKEGALGDMWHASRLADKAERAMFRAQVRCPGYMEEEHEYPTFVGRPGVLLEDTLCRLVNGWVAFPRGTGTFTTPCFRCVPCAEDHYRVPPTSVHDPPAVLICDGCKGIPQLPAFRRLLKRDAKARDSGVSMAARPYRGPVESGGRSMMQFGELVAHVGGLTTEVSALRRTLRRQSFFSRKENVEAWLERLPRKAKLEVGCAQGIGFRARSIHALDNLFKVCFPTPPPLP